jgi:hypothetical protein
MVKFPARAGPTQEIHKRDEEAAKMRKKDKRHKKEGFIGGRNKLRIF